MVVHQLCSFGFSQQGHHILGFAEFAPVGGPYEVGAFYWTVPAPDIVNLGREEQGLVSV